MIKPAKTLLVVDDNKEILTAVSLLMKDTVEVVTSPTPAAIPELLRKHRPQVVLLDMNFRAAVNTGNEGLYWLSEIRRLSPQTAVVLFTAYADVSLAVEGMKAGAVDFVVKPFNNSVLASVLSDAFRGKGRKNAPASKSQMFWGDSPAMQSLRHVVERVAATDANVLITGENGTGKDLLAREIHRLSPRADGPLESVDMGAVTPTLFESEVFGHAKGAFTDALTDRAGKFETAHGGTLFLDEIGNLPYPLQAKLLTALQQRSIVRVGSNTPRPIDIRLICATNLNIPAMVASGDFRQDLYYRINTVEIELPPLRSRADDIPAFVDLFLQKYSKLYGKPVPEVSPEALRRLRSLRWPGNIRQLEHVVEKALIMSDAPVLRPEDFDLFEQPVPQSTSPAGTLEEVERQAIAASMRDCAGNLAEVARRLGITRQTLYNKIRKYGL